MLAKMNILIVARVDHTGSGHALMQAINAHTKHKARAVSFKQSWIKYPYDVLAPSPAQLRELLRWADVLNLHDEAASMLPAGTLGARRPVITTYHGSWYRSKWKQINARDKANGYIQTCLTIDLSVHGPMWIGRPMPDLSHLKRESEQFTVIHSPTQRHRKGTKTIIQALKGLDVKLELIEKVTNAQCLKRKAKGDVLIDQIGPKSLGYGTNALEAWAIGMPVVSQGPMFALKEFNRQVGYIPFAFPTATRTLKGIVAKMQADSEYYNDYLAIGRRFLMTWHHPAIVARKFVKLCERTK
jgi:hypothetical protein